ncbi:MAG: hypothetical protein KDN22_23780 [Verrucomicrobiae bacterium]|nr:hypothetical protein [Verrucomicrobiae bacterium]
MFRPFIACALIASAGTASAQNYTDAQFFLDYKGPSTDSYSMTRVGRKIYVGGGFLDTAGKPDLKNLARFNLDTESWEQVPGINSNHRNFVRSLHKMDDGTLVVGGDFTSIGGVAAQKVALFDPKTDTWSQLLDTSAGDDSTGPQGGGVQSITSSGDYIYIGADILWNTDNPDWKHVRRYNTVTKKWSSAGLGLDETVHTMTTDAVGNVIAGGGFTKSGTTEIAALAMWNGSAWSEIGGGVDGFVRAVAIAPDGRLFVGGQFTSVGGQTANNIAAWNGTSWDTLNGGVLASDSVNGVFGMSIDQKGRVYIAGEFDRAGADNSPLNNVALWDGSGSWRALGSGLGKSSTQIVQCVYALGDDVYFSGVFADPNGSPNAKKNFARWNATRDFTDYLPGLGGLERSFSIKRDGNDLIVSFETISGVSYVLQGSDSSLGGWRNVSASNNGVDGRTYTFTIPMANSSAYYRVLAD